MPEPPVVVVVTSTGGSAHSQVLPSSLRQTVTVYVVPAVRPVTGIDCWPEFSFPVSRFTSVGEPAPAVVCVSFPDFTTLFSAGFIQEAVKPSVPSAVTLRPVGALRARSKWY